jgi:hypothetical protein
MSEAGVQFTVTQVFRSVWPTAYTFGGCNIFVFNYCIIKSHLAWLEYFDGQMDYY